MLEYDWLLTALIYGLIGDLHYGVILLPRQECFLNHNHYNFLKFD